MQDNLDTFCHMDIQTIFDLFHDRFVLLLVSATLAPILYLSPCLLLTYLIYIQFCHFYSCFKHTYKHIEYYHMWISIRKNKY